MQQALYDPFTEENGDVLIQIVWAGANAALLDLGKKPEWHKESKKWILRDMSPEEIKHREQLLRGIDERLKQPGSGS